MKTEAINTGLSRGIQCTTYGNEQVLKPCLLPIPATGENQIRVKVMCSSVTRGDVLIRSGKPFAIRLFAGLTKPKNPILGHEFSGIVDEVGSGVKHFSKGQKVMGSLGTKSGAYAEYIVVDAEQIVRMPEHVGFESAAVAQVGGMTALWFLRQMDILPGQRLLVYGASGSVGSSAVQLAIAMGAEVTALCGPDAADTMRKIGASEVLNYHTWNQEQWLGKFDAVFDAAGKLGLKKAEPLFKDRGVFASTAFQLPPLLKRKCMAKRGIRSFSGLMQETTENRKALREYMAMGAFRPVIDRCFHLSQMQEAHHYVEYAKKIGNVPVRFFIA